MRVDTVEQSNVLLNHLRFIGYFKTDLALAQHLGVNQATLANIRHGRLPVGSVLILKIHDKFGMKVADIKEIAGVPKMVDKGMFINGTH